MDVVTHGLVGAATGFYFGHPVAGAAIAVAPDLVLGITRRKLPSQAYNATHSALVLTLAAAFAIGVAPDPLGWLVLWCWLSHLTLDVPTHGTQWAPPLLYPLHQKRFSAGSEWEFFNRTWQRGALLSILWSVAWIALALSR